jgi:hypothetical protein
MGRDQLSSLHNVDNGFSNKYGKILKIEKKNYGYILLHID